MLCENGHCRMFVGIKSVVSLSVNFIAFGLSVSSCLLNANLYLY